jgi:hypothetical protein
MVRPLSYSPKGYPAKVTRMICIPKMEPTIIINRGF